jgi:uncharacterized protein (DUF1697 family)
MANRYVAFLRGINVGKAKRVAMADLRTMMEGLGYGDCRTLLNSGNVVFTAGKAAPKSIAARIEQALTKETGVTARVTVLTAADFATAVKENTLAKVAKDPTRLFVSFFTEPSGRALVTPLTRQDWKPEALAVGSHAAYLWCPDGLLVSRLPEAVGRVLKDATTMRNWATVTKVQALL